MILLDKAIDANNYCKEIETAFMDILRPIDMPLNLNQMIILYSINNTDSPHQEEVISKTAMNHNLNKLINMGLINKITNYCTDKRRIKFELTKRGKELLKMLAEFENKLIKKFGVNYVK